MESTRHSTITSIQVVIIVAITLMAGGISYWVYSSSSSSTPEQTLEPTASVELPTTYLRYSRFGFSFDYPEGMTFTAGALFGGFDHVRPLSGDIQGVIMQIPETMGVIWVHNEANPAFDLFLNELFASAVEAGGFQEISRGSMETLTKDDHETVYQTFDFRDNEGTPQTGAVGAWYEEEEQRIYALYTVTIPEVAEVIDLKDRFQLYLDSFDSEGWEPPDGDNEFYWPTESWRYAKPEDIGIEASMLYAMVEAINEQDIGADSVLVIRDGYIVMDAYFPPFDEEELHIVYSCTKSVVSTLIGIAIREGYIESLDQRLLDFFPGRDVENMNQWKEEITLKDMLTMSAGFDARDSWLFDWRWLDQMHEAPDSAQYVLNLKVIEEPGTRFEYTNGVSHLLSCILTETTGLSALEYAQEHLFGPLGINDVEWTTDSVGRNWGYSSLYLTPHDMAKIGYLFLNSGEWDGQQIISREWVEDATSKHLDANIMPGYGYQWWVNPEGYYSAVGYKGQFIHVVPDFNLIMVTTSSSADDFNSILSLLETYVIPSVID